MRTHKQHIARVGKALAATAIGLELLGKAIVSAGQIPDRVIVLGIGKPPHCHLAGIASLGRRQRIERPSHPPRQKIGLIVRELLGLPWRHVAVEDGFLHILPKGEFLRHVRIG